MTTNASAPAGDTPASGFKHQMDPVKSSLINGEYLRRLFAKITLTKQVLTVQVQRLIEKTVFMTDVIVRTAKKLAESKGNYLAIAYIKNSAI